MRNSKGQFIKGKRPSIKTEFKKGAIPWNKGTKGIMIAWNKGTKQLQSTGEKHWNYGKHRPTEVKEKISKKLTGRKGAPCWCAGKKRLDFSNEKHPLWKGDDVGYQAIHGWVRRYKGYAKKCECCGKIGKKINNKWSVEWANIDHKYKRNLEDYIALCHKCHSQYDRKIIIIN